MVKSISIFQLKDNEEANKFLFMSYRFVKNNPQYGIALYDEIYTTNIEIEEEDNINILDTIYEKFNINRPDDFNGHSLSTSDIIKMDGKYFYCDSFGWVEITDKFTE